MEGQHKPPTAAVKKSEPPSWVKANRLTRPGGNARGAPTALPGVGRSLLTGQSTPSTVSRLPDSPTGWESAPTPPGHIHTPAAGAGDRTRGAGTHVVLERTCRKCRKRWTPQPDWNSLSVGRRRMGISVQSEVSVLREECRLPFGLIQRHLKWRFGLRLSVGNWWR